MNQGLIHMGFIWSEVLEWDYVVKTGHSEVEKLLLDNVCQEPGQIFTNSVLSRSRIRLNNMDAPGQIYTENGFEWF